MTLREGEEIAAHLRAVSEAEGRDNSRRQRLSAKQAVDAILKIEKGVLAHGAARGWPRGAGSSPRELLLCFLREDTVACCGASSDDDGEECEALRVAVLGNVEKLKRALFRGTGSPERAVRLYDNIVRSLARDKADDVRRLRQKLSKHERALETIRGVLGNAPHRNRALPDFDPGASDQLGWSSMHGWYNPAHGVPRC